MTKILTPDICVIGGGSGGLSVAAAAAAMKVDVVLLEKDKMGGDCLNTGCVPSKALIAAAKAAHNIKFAEKFGIKSSKTEIDFKSVMAHVKRVIADIEPHDSVERFTGLGVHVIEAAGHFIDDKTVQAGDTLIKARRFVIATGSSPAIPPLEGLEKTSYLTNETLFELQELPKQLIIIGGGPIGLEMAQSFARLGSKVSVIEMFSPLARTDPELTAIALKSIQADGVQLFTGTKIHKVRQNKNKISLDLEQKDGTQFTHQGTHLLIATGRKPNMAGLGLDAAGIQTTRRGIKVTQNMKTSNTRVYAIGDVAGGLQFTHMANYHAGLVIRNALFRIPVKENNHIIPAATYTDPEIAEIGMSEFEAREHYGNDFSILRWPFSENDRARAEGKTDGLLKVITTKKGVILGVGIVGYNAGELINIWSFAISKRLKINSFMSYVSPYPTWSEVHKMAAIKFMKPKLNSPWLPRILTFLRSFN